MQKKTGMVMLGILGVIVVGLTMILFISINRGGMAFGSGLNVNPIGGMELVKEEKIKAGEIKKLGCDITSAQVEIKTTTEKDFRVEIYANTQDKSVPFEVKTNSDRLDIKQNRQMYSFFDIRRHYKVVVNVPAEKICDYYVELSSGEISVQAVKASNIKMEVGSGEIEADFDPNVKVSQIELRVASGEVSLSANAQEVRTKVTSGEVIMEGEFDKEDIQVTSGEVEMNHLKQPESIELDVTSGETKIYLPEPEKLQVSGKVASGKIYNKATGERFEKNFKTNGTGTSVKVEVTSGDVIIDYQK